jgi:hypothetical protein
LFLRLKVPPGTAADEQQLEFPDGPHVLARPLQLGGAPHTPPPQLGVPVGHDTAAE